MALMLLPMAFAIASPHANSVSDTTRQNHDKVSTPSSTPIEGGGSNRVACTYTNVYTPQGVIFEKHCMSSIEKTDPFWMAGLHKITH